jgi:TDG/mug DNA glycosylase family protein
MTADDDYKLLQVGIGFTNMVARATKGSADLTRKEIKEGMCRVCISTMG